MKIDLIFVYGIMLLFSVGVVGLIMYSVIRIIAEGIKCHKMDKEIWNSMTPRERQFKKRIWK